MQPNVCNSTILSCIAECANANERRLWADLDLVGMLQARIAAILDVV